MLYNKQRMRIRYDHQRSIYFHIRGERAFGKEADPRAGHDDLTSTTAWAEQGYCVAPWLDEPGSSKFEQGVEKLFSTFLHRVGITVGTTFDLARYHAYTQHNDAWHLAVVNQAKLLSTSHFPGGVQQVEQRVSELCQVPVQAVNPHNGEQVFHFRIVRPQKNDNNPFHRDVWLEEYHDAINIYVPLAGSNESSSLTLVPGSHRWSEATVERTRGGAKVNGVQYNVPAVTASRRPLEPIRPNPARNEVLIFSPYLLHGGAVNLNEDLTRISLEMRFWRKQ